MKHKAILVTLLFIFSFFTLLTRFPLWIETFYSQTFYPIYLTATVSIFGWIPFSVAGILIGLALLWLICWIIKKLKDKKIHVIPILNSILFMYLFFMISWGFNYHRMPVDHLLDIKMTEVSHQDIVELTELMIIKANLIREPLSEDQNGVFSIEISKEDLLKEGKKGWNELGKTYPQFNLPIMDGKPVLFSKTMLLTRITGMYFPFTSEPNVNIATPDLLIPATLLHETAHQLGIAPEDQANFMAYLAGTYHPDPSFHYSVLILSIMHMMNAVLIESVDDHEMLYRMLSDKIVMDLNHYKAFWQQVPNLFSNVSHKINDLYLKLNNQKEGTKSYQMMVVWLVSYHRYVDV
jgi:hypothetical protein